MFEGHCEGRKNIVTSIYTKSKHEKGSQGSGIIFFLCKVTMESKRTIKLFIKYVGFIINYLSMLSLTLNNCRN